MPDPSSSPTNPLQAAEALLAAGDAAEMEALLRHLARQLRPFPPFPGAFFTDGVEVEPEGATRRDVGCVIVTPDGDVKELQIGVDAEAFERPVPPDPVALREERLVDLRLPPPERLLYAYAGVRRLLELIREREADAPPRPS